MRSVIVIDDQPLEGEMISYVLSQHRPDIEYAGQAINAAAGIILSKNSAADIIFLDIKMPGMDGISAIERLRKARPGVHIIMLTAFDDFEYIRSALRAGAKDYLLKPVRPEDILSALDRCKTSREPEALTDEPEGQEGYSQKLRAAIISGKESEAVKAAEDFIASYGELNSSNCVKVCLGCMELASGVLNAYPSPGSINDGLAYHYQSFLKSISNPVNLQDLPYHLKNFARRAAGMFSHTAGDLPFCQVAQAKRYVESHIHEDITLGDVAKQMFLSPAYLSRLFREKTGQTFSSFLAGCRLEHAKLLLSTTDLSVSEIAASIGYKEANSFSRFFKGCTGLSPTGYRSSVGAIK